MKVLYIDIETTGLSLDTENITVIGVVHIEYITPRIKNVCGVELLRKCFNVCIAVEEGTTSEIQIKKDVLDEMERCDIMVAYNGIKFDTPFILKWLGCEERKQEFDDKTLDFYNVNRIVLSRSISMQQMCVNNKIIAKKYANGKQAIIWAEERNWTELEYYCMQDVNVMISLTEKAVNTGLLLVNFGGNKNSAYTHDSYFETVVLFSETWVPMLPTKDTKQVNGMVADSTTVNIYDIDFKSIFS
jgi:hypothetical protein